MTRDTVYHDSQFESLRENEPPVSVMICLALFLSMRSRSSSIGAAALIEDGTQNLYIYVIRWPSGFTLQRLSIAPSQGCS